MPLVASREGDCEVSNWSERLKGAVSVTRLRVDMVVLCWVVLCLGRRTLTPWTAGMCTRGCQCIHHPTVLPLPGLVALYACRQGVRSMTYWHHVPIAVPVACLWGHLRALEPHTLNHGRQCTAGGRHNDVLARYPRPPAASRAGVVPLPPPSARKGGPASCSSCQSKPELLGLRICPASRSGGRPVASVLTCCWPPRAPR